MPISLYIMVLNARERENDKRRERGRQRGGGAKRSWEGFTVKL